MEEKLTDQDYWLAAEKAYIDYRSLIYIPFPISNEEKNHIVHVASSVLMTRDEFMTGGSFVQAIVDNNLYHAVNRADSTMQRCLCFMSAVCNNVRVTTSPKIFEPSETN
jgi:hypothetical protein